MNRILLLVAFCALSIPAIAQDIHIGETAGTYGSWTWNINGTDRGVGAQAIARWVTVPHQVIDEPHYVAVSAWHINGIDKVEFECNAGTVYTVDADSKRVLPSIGGGEVYAVRVNPSDFSQHTIAHIRAKVYPKGYHDPTNGNAKTRTLWAEDWASDFYEGEMMLGIDHDGNYPTPNSTHGGDYYIDSVNGHDFTGDGSSNLPWKTIDKALKQATLDGSNPTTHARPFPHYQGMFWELMHAANATIRLKDGAYFINRIDWQWRDSWMNWVNILPAAGASPTMANKVGTGSSNSANTAKLHIKGIAFTNFILGKNGSTGNDYDWVWIDNCRLDNGSRLNSMNTGWTPGFNSIYLTENSFSNCQAGAKSAKLVRNCSFNTLSDDVFDGCVAVFNCYINDLWDPNGVHHEDIMEGWPFGAAGSDGYTAAENIIFQNVLALECKSQGFYGVAKPGTKRRFKDIAFVNCLFETYDGGGNKFQEDKDTGSVYGEIEIEHMLFLGCTITDGFNWRMANSDVTNLQAIGNCWKGVSPDDTSPGTGNNQWGGHDVESNHYDSVTYTPGTDVTTSANQVWAQLFSAGANNYRPARDSVLLNRGVNQYADDSATNLVRRVYVDLGGTTRYTQFLGVVPTPPLDTCGAYTLPGP